jgi:hypothetical protein
VMVQLFFLIVRTYVVIGIGNFCLHKI